MKRMCHIITLLSGPPSWSHCHRPAISIWWITGHWGVRPVLIKSLIRTSQPWTLNHTRAADLNIASVCDGRDLSSSDVMRMTMITDITSLSLSLGVIMTQARGVISANCLLHVVTMTREDTFYCRQVINWELYISYHDTHCGCHLKYFHHQCIKPVRYELLSLSDTETESQHLNISFHHLFCSNWIHNQASVGLAETDNLVIAKHF